MKHNIPNGIAIVIVLYKPNKSEIDNVSHLANLYPGAIIDNSPLKSFQYKNSIGKMSYIYNQGSNNGIAKAQNQGLRLLKERKDISHIVFLDQDSTIPDSYPKDIVNAFEIIKEDFPNLAFLGPMTVNKGTGKEYKSIIHKDQVLSSDFILRREIISSGGCTTMDILEKIGLNDERLFIDYVDFEWCWRARSKGYICGQTPNIVIKHMVGQKTIYIRGYTIIISSPVRYYYQFRNHLWLLRRGYVPLEWKVNHAIKNIARLIYFPLLIKSGTKYWKYMMKGLLAGLTSPK